MAAPWRPEGPLAVLEVQALPFQVQVSLRSVSPLLPPKSTTSVPSLTMAAPSRAEGPVAVSEFQAMLYVNWSLVAGVVPPGVVTVMFTVPAAPLGLVATIVQLPSPSQVGAAKVAALVPNLTAEAFSK